MLFQSVLGLLGLVLFGTLLGISLKNFTDTGEDNGDK